VCACVFVCCRVLFYPDKKLTKIYSTSRMRTLLKKLTLLSFFFFLAQNGITEMQNLPEWGSIEDFQEWWILNYYLIDCDVE